MKFKPQRCALLLGAFAILAVSFPASAQEVNELRCRGGEDALVKLFVIDRLDANTLSLNFNASQKQRAQIVAD